MSPTLASLRPLFLLIIAIAPIVFLWALSRFIRRYEPAIRSPRWHWLLYESAWLQVAISLWVAALLALLGAPAMINLPPDFYARRVIRNRYRPLPTVLVAPSPVKR